MKRFCTFLVTLVAFSCWINTAFAQKVSIHLVEDTPEVPIVGQVLKYRIDIDDAESLTGAHLTWSASDEHIEINSAGTSGLFTHDFSDQTFKASGLSGRVSYAAGRLTFRAIAAGSGNLRVTGTLTTTQGTVNVDTQLPIIVRAPDMSTPLPARGDFEFGRKNRAESPGWKSVGVLQTTELHLEDVVNVAEYEVEITYDPNFLGVITVDTEPGTTVVGANLGRITLRGSWTTPQSSDLHLATLLYTPVQAGGSVVRITRAILKNSPTDTPGTATGGGFYTEMIDKVITNVRVTPGEEQLTVTWDPVQGADSYIVRGFYPPYGYVEERVQAPTTTVTLTDLWGNIEYTIWVSANKNDRLFATARKGVKETPNAGLTQSSELMVRLIYFLPSGRAPQPGIDAKMDGLVKGVQQFYANQMAAHGFGRKTFQFETDASGNAVVHRVRGQFTDKHYSNLSDTVGLIEEIKGRFDTSKDIYLTVIDISSEIIVSKGNEACGIGGGFPGVRRFALMPASGNCFNLRVAAHEIGHAFGLHHDFRNDSYLMSYGWTERFKLSQCAAEVLNIHSAFNFARPVINTKKTTGEMFPPSFAFAPNAIRLRFEVSDRDGLYQAQALVTGDESSELLGCKRLSGNTHSTFEIITTYLLPKHKQTAIHLQVIDMQGNIYYSKPYPINIIDVLSSADVNGDGVVNIQDLVFVASRLGQAGGDKADVNGDGVVNIQDLVFVAGELGGDAAAPAAWHRTSLGVPTRATVAQWLVQAQGLPLTDARSQRGVLLLERFFAALAPEETALLTNYPNPFNPETWIPYHLAEPADVTLTIYSVDGKVVRELDLGHQAAGFYQSKSRAVYWDGRNALGERVASGVYFYTLEAGTFTATRKMLIIE